MSPARPIVLLADDHPMVLEGLAKLLSPDFEIVGAVTDGRALLEAAALWRPDLVIVDISMPGIDGIEATRRLRDLVPEARVLILSCHTEPSWVHAAFAAGACGYLIKTSAPEEVENAAREAVKGNFYISPAIAYAVLGRPGQERETARRIEASQTVSSGALTSREMEIVHLLGKGLSNKEIASQSGVSVTTVRTHLAKVYRKVGSVSRIALALYAAQSGEAVM
ncbi:MAG TPA: response regulator transcription factor [Thermoanaerobaculia bacterium]|nr:response regulator transcription factor [Thermoanaerobaculia bacterium]